MKRLKITISLLSLLALCLAAERSEASTTTTSTLSHKGSPQKELRSATQDKKQSRQSAKQERKEKRKAQIEAEDMARYKEAMEAIEARDFVMEATMLAFKDGSKKNVFSDVNFFSVKEDKAIVQTSVTTSGGVNGMGGVTLEGRITRFDKSIDKKGNCVVTVEFSSTAGSAIVEMKLMRDSNNANAVVTPKLRIDRLTMYGKLLPSAYSRAFKGFSL